MCASPCVTQDYGWSRVLGCTVSFLASTPPDASSVDLHLGVYNALPLTLPLLGADVVLADELQGCWTVPALPAALLGALDAPFAPPAKQQGAVEAQEQQDGARGGRKAGGAGGDDADGVDGKASAPAVALRSDRGRRHCCTSFTAHNGQGCWRGVGAECGGRCAPRWLAQVNGHADAEGVARALALAHLSPAAPVGGPTRRLDGHQLLASSWTHLATRVAPRCGAAPSLPCPAFLPRHITLREQCDITLREQCEVNSVVSGEVWRCSAASAPGTLHMSFVRRRGVGRLRVERLTLYLGRHATVTFHVSSFPAAPPGHSLGGCMERLQGLDALRQGPLRTLAAAAGAGGGRRAVALGALAGPSINIQHVGPLPTLKVGPVGGARCCPSAPAARTTLTRTAAAGSWLLLAECCAGFGCSHARSCSSRRRVRRWWASPFSWRRTSRCAARHWGDARVERHGAVGGARTHNVPLVTRCTLPTLPHLASCACRASPPPAHRCRVACPRRCSSLPCGR